MPITFIAIDTYARRYGISGHSFDRLVRFVSVIDFAYLEIQREQLEKSKSEGKVSRDG